MGQTAADARQTGPIHPWSWNSTWYLNLGVATCEEAKLSTTCTRKKKRVRKENVVLKLNHSMFQDLFTNLEGRKLNSAHICLLLCVPPETISTLHQLWSPHLIKFHVTQHHKQKEKQLLKHRCFLTGNESLAHVLEKNSSFILFILHFYCPPRITALGICQ